MKAAWAVVLTSNNDYIKGIEALYYTLQIKHKSKYPLLILYTSFVKPQVIEHFQNLGCLLQKVEAVIPNENVKVNYKFQRFIETWTKLTVWSQDQFDKLVLMDADMLALQNMDELMDIELQDENWIAACHACICNPQRFTHYPSFWIPENCAYTGSTHYDSITNNEFNYFNSGLIVLRPSKEKFNEMLSYLNSLDDLSIYPFPDQDFLNEIFKDKWIHLPFIYNALKTLEFAHKPMWDLKHIKNIHYIITKPWDIKPNETLSATELIYKPLYEIWWKEHKQLEYKLEDI